MILRGGRPVRPPAAVGYGEEAPAINSEELKLAARGSAEWNGDLKSGQGKFTAGDTISGKYSFGTRFEDAPGANPEQLIAAAHSSCFSMFLSLVLGEDGITPESVRTEATVSIETVDGAPRITKSRLVCKARIPGIDDAAFQKAAETARDNCPVSKALAGVDEITLDATLDTA